MLSPWIASFYLKHHYAVLKLLTFFNRLFLPIYLKPTSVWTQKDKNCRVVCFSCSSLHVLLDSHVPKCWFIILPWVLSTHAGSLLNCSISVTFVLTSSGNISSTSLDKLCWTYGTMWLVGLVMDYTRALVYCYTLSGFGLHPCFFLSFGDVIKGFIWVMERIYPLKARSTLNLEKDWTLGMADWAWGQCSLCCLEWWSQGGEAERKLTTRAEHSVTR